MTNQTDEERDLTQLEEHAHALMLELAKSAGDLDATASVLHVSRERHGFDEHRRIAECALLRLFGTWA